MRCRHNFGLFLPLAISLLVGLLASFASGKVQLAPELVETKKIWDAAPHNAFTDLLFWRGKFYCAFREGKGHAGDIGKLRIISSKDGAEWKSVGLLSSQEFDLRDAAISITPKNQLKVLGGAQRTIDGQRRTGTFVSFSNDGVSFSAPKIVLPPGRWLWRVTWHKDVAYGVSYPTPDGEPYSALHKTTDGIHYETVTDKLLSEGGRPTEARLRFAEDGTCYCLHRRDGTHNSAFLGTAKPPYADWKWKDLGQYLGGPNFVQLPNGEWVGVGRLHGERTRTSLVHLDVDRGTMTPLLDLPSGGDTSYPGMVWHNNLLWVSYYSSHEGKTSIYMAKIRFPSITKSVTSIDIGNRLELFVDHHLIDRMESTTLKMHHPVAKNVVLTFDKPWEGAFCGYMTVLQDGDLFRMYYRGLPKAGRDGTESEVTCYAESRDGITWYKPNLGIYEIDGNGDNNIVLRGQTPASHNFCPFLDSNPKVPKDQRYKALGGTKKKGLMAFVSADGLNWKRLHEKPVITQGAFDSQNLAFYSKSERQYVCYFRSWLRAHDGGFRSISRTTSDDFINWTEPVAMSFGDVPNEHLYTNQTSPYVRAPHIYVSVAARFMPGRQVLTPRDAQQINVNPRYFRDCSDAVLLTSRGGNVYQRTFMESFIRPGLGLENWVSRTNYPALGIVPTGKGELSLYVQKNYGQPTSRLQRFVLRTDGFVSIHAGYNGGEMVTKPITFSKDEDQNLHLNLATSAAGSIRVELQDETGTPLPGFTLNDCAPIIGDRIDRVVNWNDNQDLRDLAGRSVRMRFVMKDADLYSLQIR